MDWKAEFIQTVKTDLLSEEVVRLLIKLQDETIDLFKHALETMAYKLLYGIEPESSSRQLNQKEKTTLQKILTIRQFIKQSSAVRLSR